MSGADRPPYGPSGSDGPLWECVRVRWTSLRIRIGPTDIRMDLRGSDGTDLRMYLSGSDGPLYGSVWVCRTSIWIRIGLTDIRRDPYGSAWVRWTPYVSVWVCVGSYTDPYGSIGVKWASVWIRRTSGKRNMQVLLFLRWGEKLTPSCMFNSFAVFILLMVHRAWAL